MHILLDVGHTQLHHSVNYNPELLNNLLHFFHFLDHFPEIKLPGLRVPFFVPIIDVVPSRDVQHELAEAFVFSISPVLTQKEIWIKLSTF